MISKQLIKKGSLATSLINLYMDGFIEIFKSIHFHPAGFSAGFKSIYTIPANPIKAIARIPAVISAIGVPFIPFGIL